MLTSGLFMGYIALCVHYLETFELFEPLLYWPFLAAIASAAICGFLLFMIKHRTKQERFYQFYLLIAAAVFSFVSGMLFLYEYGNNKDKEISIVRSKSIISFNFVGIPATYIFAVSHGVSYVSTHSYMNVRVSGKLRHFRLSLSHIWYLVGCMISISLIDIDSGAILNRIGTLIIATSTLSFVLLTLNELMHTMHVYNYKQMLDPIAEQANNSNTLYLNRTDTIQFLKINNINVDGKSLSVLPIRKRSMATFLLLIMKLNGAMLFSIVMLLLAGNAGVQPFQQYSFLWIGGMAVTGAVISSGLCLFYGTKTIFGMASTMEVIVLIAAMIVYVVDDISSISVPFSLFYVALGIAYCISDIALLDTASLLRTEISLCVGYTIEMIGIGLQQYLLYNSSGIVISIQFYTHTGICLGVGMVLLLVVAIVYPNTFGKSLQQIRDDLFGISFVNEVDRVDVIQTSLPPAIYGYNSRTGTYNYPKTVTVNTNVLPLGRMQATSNPYASQGLYRNPSGGPAFGMNNQSSNNFNMMNPGYLIPRAIIGGAIFGSIAMNM